MGSIPASGRTRGLRVAMNALRLHYPEYLMEAASLGMFMISAAVFTTLLEHPASPIREAIADPLIRRFLIGVAMGLTAIAIVYSPWGKQSGAHLNPAFTLTFFRLGKVKAWDAFFYILFQFFGGLIGLWLAGGILREAIADPSVNYIVTTPGMSGIGIAFLAELIISFGMMLMVLLISDLAPFAFIVRALRARTINARFGGASRRRNGLIEKVQDLR